MKQSWKIQFDEAIIKGTGMNGEKWKGYIYKLKIDKQRKKLSKSWEQNRKMKIALKKNK